MENKMQTFIGLKGLNFEGYRVPVHTQGTLHRYVFNRYTPGGFGRAILAGDIDAAEWRADVENKRAISEIELWIKDNLPEEIHGSYEKVDSWCGG